MLTANAAAEPGSGCIQLQVHVVYVATFYPFLQTIELSMYAKLIFSLAVITVAALFSAGSAEAAKGPKITHKVYFDIKHGDKNLGRSAFLQLSLNFFCTDSRLV